MNLRNTVCVVRNKANLTHKLNAFHSVVLDKIYLCNTVKHNYFIKTKLQEVFK